MARRLTHAPESNLTGVVRRNIHALLEVRRETERRRTINLPAEHEVTKLIRMMEALCQHMKVETDTRGLDELKRDVAPEAVLDAIEKTEEELST